MIKHLWLRGCGANVVYCIECQCVRLCLHRNLAPLGKVMWLKNMAVLMLCIALIISVIGYACDSMSQLENLHGNQKRMVAVQMWYTVLNISALGYVCTATMSATLPQLGRNLTAT